MSEASGGHVPCGSEAGHRHQVEQQRQDGLRRQPPRCAAAARAREAAARGTRGRGSPRGRRASSAKDSDWRWHRHTCCCSVGELTAAHASSDSSSAPHAYAASGISACGKPSPPPPTFDSRGRGGQRAEEGDGPLDEAEQRAQPLLRVHLGEHGVGTALGSWRCGTRGRRRAGPCAAARLRRGRAARACAAAGVRETGGRGRARLRRGQAAHPVGLSLRGAAVRGEERRQVRLGIVREQQSAHHLVRRAVRDSGHCRARRQHGREPAACSRSMVSLCAS